MYAYRTQRDPSYIENFISTSFTGTSFTANKKKVIADTELNKLQHITFKKEDELHTNIECPIMCYEFSENEEIIKLPCQHNYNKDAILKWLKQESHTCPICRYEFEYKEINNSKDENNEDEDIDEDNLPLNFFGLTQGVRNLYFLDNFIISFESVETKTSINNFRIFFLNNFSKVH
jgi:hypothetical protein